MCGVFAAAFASKPAPTFKTHSKGGSGLAREEASQPTAKALAKRLARAPAANCITD